jgi:LysR family hydrogen peroxide-inducible transcriptional activator
MRPISTAAWHGIELRHLAALAAVVREGSFHRAAAALGYTQSAISLQIAGLERAVGQQLVVRPGRGRTLALTPAGKRLVELESAVSTRISVARAEVEALAAGVATPLRLGTPFAMGRLAAALKSFWARRSERIELVEGSQRALLRLLEDDSLDLAVVRGSPRAGALACLPVGEDDYVGVVAAGSPLAKRREPLEHGQLAMPLLLPDDDLLHEILRSRFVGSRELIRFRSGDPSLLLELAAGGLGLALVPRLAVPDRADVVTLALPPDFPRVPLTLVWPAARRPSAALEALREALRETLACSSAGPALRPAAANARTQL